MKTQIMNLFRTMGKNLKSLKSLMQIFAESAESAKSAKPIFATYATYASANFVGKGSNESTVMCRVKSRISLIKPLLNPYLTLTRFRLSLGSNHSRSVCSPQTPSLFKAKSQLAFPRLCLASLICLCMLTVGVGNAWGDKLVLTFNGTTNAYSLVTTASTSQNTFTQGTTTLGYKSCVDGSNSGKHYIQFNKGAGVLYNTTAIPGKITNIKVEYRDGTSEKSDLGVKCGTSKIDTRQTSSLDATLDTDGGSYADCDLDESDGFTYFNLSVQGGTSSSYGNIQVTQITITYTSSAATKTYHEWNGSSAFTTSSGGATLKEVPSLCDWAIEPYGWCSEENYASSTYPTSKIWFKDASWPAGKTDLYALYRVGSDPYYYSTKPTIYSITYNLTNAIKDAEYSYTCMSDMEDAIGTSNFSAYFKPAAGYILDESCISVTMGGSPVSSSNYYWDYEYSWPDYDYTAEFYMENITGNVVVTVTGKTCTPLAAPTGLTLSTDHQGTAGKTRFGWNSVSGATGYKVTVTKGGVSTSVTTASDRYYYITTLPDGDYTWTVQALGDGSTYCAEGTAANGTPFSYCHKDVSGVTPTVNAATSIGKYGATANWTAVTDADHYTVKVYRGSNASGTLEKTYEDVVGTSQVITGLSTHNTTYYIEVQAHDACGHNSSKGGVTFTTLDLTLYTVTFVNAAGEAPAAVTQISEGGTVSIPDAEACDGWEFAGWKIGGAQDAVTSDPTGSGYIKNATYPFNYTPGSNITAHAVFKKTEGGGGDTEVLAKSIGFESGEGFTASTTYNNESTPNTQGPTSEKWDFIMGTPSTNDALKNSQSAQMRSYSNKDTEGYVMMKYDISRVTKVKFLAKNNGTGDLHCYYSSNSGSTWTGDQAIDLTTDATYYTYTVSATGAYANVRIKFQNETTGAAGRVYIDSVYIYHMEAGGGTTTWKSDVSCTCPNYSFHSKNSSSVWDDPICFAQVGSSTLYRTEEIELPTDGVSFKVGWHDADDVANAKTNEKDWQYMVAGPTTTRLGGGYWTFGGHLTSGNAGGAKGYFYVYSDSNEDNKYVGFTPSGYVLRWGKSESWTSKAFTAASASIDETEWNTEAITLSSSNASDHIYVGLKTESGYVWCNNSEEQRVIFLSPGVWDSEGCKFGLWDKTHLAWRGFMQDADGDGVYEGTVPSSCTEVTFARFDGAKTEPVWDQQYNKSADQTISSLTDKNMFSVTGWGSTYCEGNWNTVYSKPGVFRINAGSNLKNWSCKFVPHFVLTYDKNNNDAIGTTTPTTVASDAVSKNVSVAACGFTAPTGYHFDHWDTAPDGSGTDYAPDATYNLTADATLYAIWAANTHTLTWNLDGGDISSAGTAAGTVAYGTVLTAPTVTKTGYTFNVWSPVVPSTMPDADATYTATWTPITYKVQFHENGGSGSMSDQNFTYGVAQNLSTCTFTKDGKSMGGWATSAENANANPPVKAYDNGEEVNNLTATNGATVDLYAIWVDCSLYTVTLNVNGSAWKTVTQGSCGASIALSSYQDVPACDAKYTFVGWCTTNPGITSNPAITKTSSYTPEANTTLYAVYSYSAKMGTLVKNTTGFGGAYKSYIIAASGYNSAMGEVESCGTVDPVTISKEGDNCFKTGSGELAEFYFEDAGSSKWFIYQPYIDSEDNYGYIYMKAPTGSGGKFCWYDDEEYSEWYIYDDNIKPYGYYDYDYIQTYMKTHATDALWSLSINGTTGVATLTAVDAGSSTRSWQYNNSPGKFSTYTTTQKPIAIYEYTDATAYTTQPSMTYYTITKGATTNGSISISKGVVCSGSVDVVATADPGYTFSGWSITSGSGSFGSTSTASTTFTPSANATITATFVAATPHDITWMVNGSAYTTGTPTSSLTAGTSFSTMTLPTAPANNTLSSACSAVANQFVGWSQTDMGFATGQSAPAKLFTDAAGAGTAYGVMGGEDVTFYAVFAQDGSSNYMSRCPNTYSIVLDKKEGSADGSATATEMGTSLTDIIAPTRLGYSVEGYYKEVGTTTKVATPAGALQNGSGSGIDGWTNSSSQFIGTSDGTLYTKWNIITYNLTYENLNGASNSNPATYNVTTATINLADPGSIIGYTFVNWTCGGSPITQIVLGSTGDKTITANWNAQQYAITYMDKDGAPYSGDKTDGRPNGNPANHTYGAATALANGTRTGYRFDGWYTSSDCSTGKITSLGATDYTSAITLYAKWTASHTYSFSKNGVVDGSLQLGAVEGETVTMPNTTVDCGLWTTFVGWVEGDVAETTTEPATIYRAGDIYEVPLSSGDKTFKAVYSKHEGDASVTYEKVTSGLKSGEYILVSSPKSDVYYTTTGWNSGSSIYATAAVTLSLDGTISSANATSAGANTFTVHAGTGTNAGKFAIYDGAKYMASGSSISRGDAHSYTWELLDGSTSVNDKTYIPGAGAIHSTSSTTYVLQLRNHSNADRFAMYANTQNLDVYLYRKKVAGTTYYATNPASCDVPTQIEVSYNDNKANAGDQTISGMPSGTTLTFTSYPNFASYTVGAAPTDPTGYHFAGWNTQVDGNGDDYTAGSSVTTFGYRETITLYAKWERVYTVTLYDNGVQWTTLTQASAGATVDLPTGNNCGVGSPFTFEGWTESAAELTADPVRPVSATLHAAGAWEPTSDITLYSVYSRSVGGCDDFAAGVSGAYTVSNGDKYATTTGGSSSAYGAATSGTAEIFYIAYAPAHSAYTIRTSGGYVGWSGAAGSEAMSKNNSTPYYWKISGSSTNWVITPEPTTITKQLKISNEGSEFKLFASGTSGKAVLTKSAMTYYYNVATCEDATITFHDGGGTISGTPTTPAGASWNSSTHVLSGLEDCDKITTFPTASYDGWTFIGWSTEDYSNNGKHATDYAAENASTDEPDGSGIYKTDGNPYVVRGGSIDMYPIFTRFPDNESFDLTTADNYYIYYLDPGSNDGYGANIRVYAGEYGGDEYYRETTSCTAATEFQFVKDGDVWHIKDLTKNKWLAGKNNSNELKLRDELGDEYDDWKITIASGNQLYARCQGGDKRYVSYSTLHNQFKYYDCVATPGYLPIYIGSCTERIFSSEPNPTPTIDLTGEPMVTSSVGQQVRATEIMTLSASHLSTANRIKVTGTNLKFATSAAATPATPLWVDLTSGAANATIYVYYTPTATEDGLENIIVTAQAYYTNTPREDLKTTGTVHCRHLPADFVIAAKWGDKWYALPNTCAGEGSNTAGVLIEVNDANAPTAATAAPHTAKWGMRQTKAGSRSDGSYNDRLVFTERTTATANDQKTLYNYNKAEVFTNATYTNYNNTNPERYEWIPVTTDFGDYTLTNANDVNHHLILRNSDGLFVAQNSDKSYDGKVRLLPATFYDEAPVQIVEWKANSVVVMYTGTESSATTKVGTNSASSAQTLSTHKLTHGIYELTTGQSMSIGTNTNKNLLLTFGSTKKVFEIPVIITGSTNASTGYDKQDVIITKTGKLTAQSTKYSYRNIYVYGGGKLKIASGMSLGVNNIILRAGGITTSGIGSSPSATYEYIYPQVELRGTLSSTKTNIKYEYITDYDHWYHLVLPFDGTLSSITYPTEYYGDNVKGNNTGSWIVKRYAGEVRATGNYNAWVDIESESATSVTAGHGYIYWGAPKKVTIGGDKQRQQWGIQRITMPITAAAAMEAENANKVVGGLGSYSGVSGNSGQDNDQGWNLIGDPYLTNITNLSGTGIHTCKLVEVLDGNDNWTGRWEWNDETSVRYLTIPDYHFDNYTAKTIPVAVAAGDLNTGHTFFVQIEGEATGVTFEQANRAVLLPALYAETDPSIDVETGIVMADESHSDEVNFWIKDGKTAEYEYNADYPKTPNSSNFNLYGVHSHGDLSWIAISPEIAEGSMAIGYQVPAAGNYSLHLSETYVSSTIEHLYVTDHAMSPEVTVDLLEGPYSFTVMQAETNNERFTVSIKLAEQEGTPTDIYNVDGNAERPWKFLYHDKIYILRNGVIYDATGKKVGEINK